MFQNKIRSRISSTVFFLLFCLILTAQNPYKLDLKKELPILGLGFIGESVSLLIARNVQPLTLAEIALLDPNDVNSFDRRAVNYNSKSSRLASDVLLYSSYTYPLLFLVDKKRNRGFTEIGVMGSEVILVNGALTTLSKILVKRTRPFVYNPDAEEDKKISRSARLSHYSGHTSSVASMSFFTAKVFSDYYPDSKWKPVVWTGAVLLPAATGYFRVKGGKHFPSDVITGLAAGALVGFLIPQIHKKKTDEQKVTLSVIARGNFVGLTLDW